MKKNKHTHSIPNQSTNKFDKFGVLLCTAITGIERQVIKLIFLLKHLFACVNSEATSLYEFALQLTLGSSPLQPIGGSSQNQKPITITYPAWPRLHMTHNQQ